MFSKNSSPKRNFKKSFPNFKSSKSPKKLYSNIENLQGSLVKNIPTKYEAIKKKFAKLLNVEFIQLNKEMIEDSNFENNRQSYFSELMYPKTFNDFVPQQNRQLTDKLIVNIHQILELFKNINIEYHNTKSKKTRNDILLTIIELSSTGIFIAFGLGILLPIIPITGEYNKFQNVKKININFDRYFEEKLSILSELYETYGQYIIELYL